MVKKTRPLPLLNSSCLSQPRFSLLTNICLKLPSLLASSPGQPRSSTSTLVLPQIFHVNTHLSKFTTHKKVNLGVMQVTWQSLMGNTQQDLLFFVLFFSFKCPTQYLMILYLINKCCRIQQSHMLVFGAAVQGFLFCKRLFTL